MSVNELVDAVLVLSVRTADCVPVLLADRASQGVAAIHAGWRGTAAGAVQSAIDAMRAAFGTSPENIVAAVGPAIGPCCYIVGEELLSKFAGHPASSRWFSRRANGTLRLDLWQATRDQLLRAGVPAARIHVAGLCTADHPDILHSFRRDGSAAGRLIAAIRPGSPNQKRAR